MGPYPGRRYTGGDPTSLVIPLDKNFVFKTQFTAKHKKFDNKIVIPMIPDQKMQSLCPGAAIRTFLGRAESVRRPGQNSLFLPLREGAVGTTKQLICKCRESSYLGVPQGGRGGAADDPCA